MEIGTLLRKLRDSKSLPTRDVAEKIGVAQSTYSDWEHDKSSPSLRNYFKIADALEICPVELMSYLTGGKVTTLSFRETEMVELKKTVQNLRSYTMLLGDEKELLKTDLKRVMDIVKYIHPI